MELYNLTDKKKYEVNIPSGIGEYYSTCPVCSHLRKPINQKKRCFSWNRTKEVGHCYHCGSSFVEFIESEKLKDKNEKHINDSITQHINYINPKYLNLSLGLDSNFGTFLKSIFNKDELKTIIDDYQLGMTKDNSVIYWYIDKENKIRSGKIMQYDPKTGKRRRDEPECSPNNGCSPNITDSINSNGRTRRFAPTWVHSELKKQNILPNDWQLTQCLFGEHLLIKYPEKSVMLVESEKTAIIMSLYQPSFNWMATGGLNNLTENKIYPVRKCEITAFADLKCFELWQSKAERINLNIGSKIELSNMLEERATKEERELGLDIADFFLSEK
ncbi:MAG TPA: hypothetical protein DD434_09765 [Bacteroidales bacterium]|nr:hypothetical protein [Bacteroidales bacterium]